LLIGVPEKAIDRLAVYHVAALRGQAACSHLIEKVKKERFNALFTAAIAKTAQSSLLLVALISVGRKLLED
jgi:hypothetical protein